MLLTAPSLASTGEAPSELACANEDGLEEMSEEDLRQHIVARGIAVPEGGGQCPAMLCSESVVPTRCHLTRIRLDPCLICSGG